jgi:hypothetical protein
MATACLQTLPPADSATVAAFWRVWFALPNVLAFRKTPCGGIGGQVFSAVRFIAARNVNVAV